MKEDFVDYYKILEVSPEASAKEIRRAWREKMQRFHPDRHLGEETRYEAISSEINRAYHILSNEKSRALFDDTRERRLAQPGATGIPVLGFSEKIILTVVVVCLSIFFFAIPPWADCGNAYLRYLFSGRDVEAVGNPIWLSSILIVLVFSGIVLLGKCLRERFIFLAFLEVFSLVVACAESVVVPLREMGSVIILVLFGIGVLCTFLSYGERKFLLWSTIFRIFSLVACVAAYRAGGLIFHNADELVSLGCLLVFAAFLIACINAVSSASD